MAFKPEYFIGGENFEVPQIYPTTASTTGASGANKEKYETT